MNNEKKIWNLLRNKVEKKSMENFFVCIGKFGKLFPFISIHLLASSSCQDYFKLSVLFIIMVSRSWFKAEVVISRCSAKIVVRQCGFCALVKALRNACEMFHFSGCLLVPPPCDFTKRWTPCQIIYKVFDLKSR